MNAMTRQYRDPELPYFAQLDSERVLIIIDNFDHSRKLSSKGRTELLNQLNSRYKRLCILGDDSLGLEELATGQLGKGALSEFSFFDLDDFGNKLRYNLIEKWYMIGVEYTVDEHEIRNKVERAAQLISGLLGKSYLPSIPIIILTFLQSLDSESPISSSAGTYGSLYEVLITQELVKIRSLKFNLDLRRTYLSEVAFWMFIHNKTVISDLEWSEFHVSYAREYHSATEKNELRDDVINLGLIKKSDESFSFNYSAQYYYFVALYFENNLHKRAEVKGIIKGLFENFHREEHSSVWLFLTHLSKDPFIVDSVVEHAKSLFSSLPTASFGAEMSVFDEIYKSVPQIVLEDIGYRERNERRFEQMDRHEEMENNDSVKDLDDNCKENEQVRQLLSSIKTLDVLGQLIKNFHGSLRGVEKFKLVKETYDLGLRTIQALLAEVAENSDVLLKEIVELIRKKHPELVIRGEIEEKVKSAVFFWVELGCFGLVKRISQAVGHAALEETYREVGFSNDSNAYSLIQLSVQLDSKGAPMNELDHWAGAFKNNAFCERLTKMLFRNHLYIFSIPEIKRQRICSKLGIEMRPASTNDMLLPGGKRI